MKNAIVAQSGGPSPVINSSLQGVIEACRDCPDSIGTLFGSFHGIEGILTENIFSLSNQNPDEIALLRTTPASGVIGTCRYKLKPEQIEDFDRIIDVFKAHNIGYFFYIGGNDSMDTANKVSELAKSKGVELIAVGVPKTGQASSKIQFRRITGCILLNAFQSFRQWAEPPDLFPQRHVLPTRTVNIQSNFI